MEAVWVVLGATAAGLLLLIAAAAFVFWKIQSSDEKKLGRRIARLAFVDKLALAASLFRDERIAFLLRVAAVGLVLYVAMPLDLIPDFIPVIGYLDDLLIVLIGAGLLLRSIPRYIIEEHVGRLEAKEAGARDRRWDPMSKLDLVSGLYEYNEWANNHVLEAASALSEDEFSRAQGASFDSVEGNLAHIMAGQVVWLARWTTASNPRPLMDVQSLTGYQAIREAFSRSHDELREFVTSLTEERFDSVLAYTDSRGNSHERVLWQLMLHVANHGTHHRAETAMALARMAKPMRELDYVFFEIERK